MPTAREQLSREMARARTAGRTVAMLPPIESSEIVTLEKRSGGPLPPEIRDLLEYSAGFSIDKFRVNFRADEAFEFDPFPRALPVGTDGAGNFWIVDVQASGVWSPVLFVSHDPPVVTIFAGDVGSFISRVLDDRAEATLNQVVTDIAKRDPYVLQWEEALRSPDDEVRRFAEMVGAGFVFCDLRESPVDRGFSWGRNGPDTEIRRDGELLVFAIQEKKKRGRMRFFSR